MRLIFLVWNFPLVEHLRCQITEAQLVDQIAAMNKGCGLARLDII